MSDGFWLSDEQFSLIQPYLPCRAAGKRHQDAGQGRILIHSVIPAVTLPSL